MPYIVSKSVTKKKDTITFAFQANIYSIILCKLLFKRLLLGQTHLHQDGIIIFLKIDF